MVPVMLMGTLVGGKVYSVLEYACALMIGGGVSLFAARNSGKVTQKLAAPNAPLGYALCLANLLLDGYTNAAQVRRLNCLEVTLKHRSERCTAARLKILVACSAVAWRLESA
jgi:hypothetical protein